jgi:sulfite reductase (ferredoxin)
MSKKHNVEQVKAESAGLLGSLPAELAAETTSFSEEGKTLLKFHGIYEQHDRDQRGRDKTYSFMLRTKLPGGQMSAEQYLLHDRIADEFANGTLRITTRQDFQFHGVLKGDLKPTLQALNNALVTSLGACGDIVRNVMACPAHTTDPQRLAVQQAAFDLNRAFFPRTRSYHQIWLDGQELVEDEVVEEPLYGKTYLPRKFKIAVAYPGDNCVDVYTNDVGLVALFDDANQLIGYNVLAGGGMGITHNNEQTIARLADEVAFIAPQHAVETVAAIVTIHRDFGDRENRKHARLKYILHDRGLAWFREELQRRVPFALELPRPMPPFVIDDHMGWQEQGDGRWSLGLPIENGRVADRGKARIKAGIRAIVERYQLPVRLTAQQSLILIDIQPQDRADIDALLAEYGIRQIADFSGVRRYSLACVALPTCSLAITEAERALPQVIDEFEQTLDELGIPNEEIAIRMTGCPNGCARPYVAEIGLVGRSLDKYTIYLGGAFNGTRLARPFIDLVPVREIVPRLRPLLAYYRDCAHDDESFGDFVNRLGFDHLQQTLFNEIKPEETSGD